MKERGKGGGGRGGGGGGELGCSVSYWRDSGEAALAIDGAKDLKKHTWPPFSVGLGAQVLRSGKHCIDFAIRWRGEGVVFIGVTVPHIAVDKTWCHCDCNRRGTTLGLDTPTLFAKCATAGTMSVALR